jgi:hypothetical protein
MPIAEHCLQTIDFAHKKIVEILKTVDPSPVGLGLSIVQPQSCLLARFPRMLVACQFETLHPTRRNMIADEMLWGIAAPIASFG